MSLMKPPEAGDYARRMLEAVIAKHDVISCNVSNSLEDPAEMSLSADGKVSTEWERKLVIEVVYRKKTG